MPGVLAGALMLAGCAKKGPETGVGNEAAPATAVDAETGFGGDARSANPDGTGAVSDETLSEEAARLERALRPVFFAFDRYDLTQESRDTLTANARLLRDNPKFDIWLEGHCDERGTNEYNLALGDRRARAAREFLVAAGVSSSRMTVISYGEEKPFASGHDEASWAQNRRAHFKVKGQGIGG